MNTIYSLTMSKILTKNSFEELNFNQFVSNLKLKYKGHFIPEQSRVKKKKKSKNRSKLDNTIRKNKMSNEIHYTSKVNKSFKDRFQFDFIVFMIYENTNDVELVIKINLSKLFSITKDSNTYNLAYLMPILNEMFRLNNLNITSDKFKLIDIELNKSFISTPEKLEQTGPDVDFMKDIEFLFNKNISLSEAIIILSCIGKKPIKFSPKIPVEKLNINLEYSIFGKINYEIRLNLLNDEYYLNEIDNIKLFENIEEENLASKLLFGNTFDELNNLFGSINYKIKEYYIIKQLKKLVNNGLEELLLTPIGTNAQHQKIVKTNNIIFSELYS